MIIESFRPKGFEPTCFPCDQCGQHFTESNRIACDESPSPLCLCNKCLRVLEEMIHEYRHSE